LDEQLIRSQELAAMAMNLAELDGIEPPEPDDPDAVKVREGQLVVDLVEPAKAEALEKLGEGERALDIATGWVRSKLAPKGVVRGESVAEKER
jgi:hypothetical protein